MLTIAQIAQIVTDGGVANLSDQTLHDAGQAVLFARDPAHLGDEPHLRFEVDNCGIDDDTLVEIEQVIWAERNKREEARHATMWLQGSAAPLKLAA